jgi:glycosyltransferase involved in cell wall biosynthesis
MIDPGNPDFDDTPASDGRATFDYAPVDPGASPQVTIITPFHNTGAVFHDTARSVRRQSFQQWEWLIVNDASTDPEALAVLDDYRHQQPRIRVIDHETNLGPGAARNSGFRAARGRYVVQLDSDNLLEPTAIEKWFWFLESYPEYAFVKGFSVGFDARQYLWGQGFHDGKAFLDANRVDATCMIRTAVHDAVRGYDETIRDGLEDWEFWLRCANAGYWGNTLPEYLDWYRRRQNHADRWKTWDEGERQEAFRLELRRRYPHLWRGGFPQIQTRFHMPHDTVPDDLPCDNMLARREGAPRVVMIVPWLTMGGADKFNLDLVQQLTERGWQVTIAATFYGDHGWLPKFTRYTPDVFVLDRFVRLVDSPRVLRYLIRSRQADVVLMSHSEQGYLLLPYLRAHCPQTTFMDFCHIEEEYWKNGGYPRMAVAYQESLDLNVVSSDHVKTWMTRQGAEPERIAVCHTNIDTDMWHPDPMAREAVRREFGVGDAVPLILFAGRIVEQKQPRVFARTMLRLHEHGVSFRALVAGDGPDLAWLHGFVARHGLGERVYLLGALPNERIQQLMAAVDVFFLPSMWEGIALSLYEAMACGVAIVGADVGGQRELVTPECGILVGRGDEDAEVERYADGLERLLKNAELRRAMGRAGRDRVASNFRLEQMGERMAALMRRAQSLHVGSPRPTPGLGLGRACAAQAVEFLRMSQLADRLWAAHNTTDPAHRNGQSWRVRLYLALYRWHEPHYRWYTKRGWTWVTPIRETVKAILLRSASDESIRQAGGPSRS